MSLLAVMFALCLCMIWVLIRRVEDLERDHHMLKDFVYFRINKGALK